MIKFQYTLFMLIFGVFFIAIGAILAGAVIAEVAGVGVLCATFGLAARSLFGIRACRTFSAGPFGVIIPTQTFPQSRNGLFADHKTIALGLGGVGSRVTTGSGF